MQVDHRRLLQQPMEKNEKDEDGAIVKQFVSQSTRHLEQIF